MSYNVDIQDYLLKLKETIDAISIEEINTIMIVLEKARIENRTIFIMGNGGSSATASHFVCDFNKGISINQSKKYRLICLNDNVPSLMAYANDLSFEDIFVEQLKNYFHEGDVVVGISGSGNSNNVLKAIQYANDNNGLTIGFTGYDGGILKKIVHYAMHVPINDMQIAEDIHMIMDHCMMKILSNY